MGMGGTAVWAPAGSPCTRRRGAGAPGGGGTASTIGVASGPPAALGRARAPLEYRFVSGVAAYESTSPAMFTDLWAALGKACRRSVRLLPLELSAPGALAPSPAELEGTPVAGCPGGEAIEARSLQ